MLELDASTPVVLVTRAQRYSSYGVLGVMRSLGRLGVPVHWVHPPGDVAAERSRYAAGSETLPADSGDEAAIRCLERIAAGLPARPILVPTDDVAVSMLDAHADVLSASYRFPAQPRGLPHRLSDKREMHALCTQLGVPTPDAAFPASADEAVEAARRMSFPVVLKGMDTTALGERTGVRLVIVPTEDELRREFARLAGPEEPGLMVQSYIPGPPQSVWMFNGYFDAASTCRFSGCGPKLRQSPPYTGATSLGVCRTNDAVRETTIRLMSAVGYRGILDIGYRYDRRDGEYKLLDVNPRLGATFRLWVAPNGLDVVRALYLDMTGQPLPTATCRDGRKWLLETSDAASSWMYRRDGRLSVRSWAGSFRGVEETGWFAPDDPRPSATAYAAAASKLARGGLRNGHVKAAA